MIIEAILCYILKRSIEVVYGMVRFVVQEIALRDGKGRLRRYSKDKTRELERCSHIRVCLVKISRGE